MVICDGQDIERLATFYTLLGFVFDFHQHGKSPYHYTATMGPTTIEIYPLSKGQEGADKNLRLDFSIDLFDEVIQLLQEQNIRFVTLPSQTDFGFMTVIEDPDGRKIELYKS